MRGAFAENLTAILRDLHRQEPAKNRNSSPKGKKSQRFSQRSSVCIMRAFLVERSMSHPARTMADAGSLSTAAPLFALKKGQTACAPDQIMSSFEKLDLAEIQEWLPKKKNVNPMLWDCCCLN
jgi:hypothetical protein